MDVTTSPGWTTTYRIEAMVSLVPRRIEGRWRWLVPHYALQGQLGQWITIERAMTPEPLIGRLATARARAFGDYGRHPHAVTEKSSYL